MKKTLLADLLEGRVFHDKDTFTERAEPNPFAKRKKAVIVVRKSDDRMGMDDFVRGRGDNRGLDRVSRSYTGADSGVNGSRYDDMVRDIDDLQIVQTPTQSFSDDQLDLDDDEDALYMTTKDLSYRKNEFNTPEDRDDIDLDVGSEFMRQLDLLDPPESDGGNDMDLDDSALDDGDDSEDGVEEPDESRFEGIVRAVKGAYLVSKKRQPDETYTEVWMYNVGKKFEDEANIRKAILAATDIDPARNFSEDGSQEAVFQTVGNVQYLTLVGIPD